MKPTFFRIASSFLLHLTTGVVTEAPRKRQQGKKGWSIITAHSTPTEPTSLQISDCLREASRASSPTINCLLTSVVNNFICSLPFYFDYITCLCSSLVLLYHDWHSLELVRNLYLFRYYLFEILQIPSQLQNLALCPATDYVPEARRLSQKMFTSLLEWR
jgi:hypothetical protein